MLESDFYIYLACEHEHGKFRSTSYVTHRALEKPYIAVGLGYVPS